MKSDTELRQEYRLNAQETVFIEVASAGVDPDDTTAATLITVSNSVDISANGLQIRTDQELPIGSIHQTCIQLDNPSCRLQLVTEVMWVRTAEETNEYLIGLSLFESEGTDIKQWKEVIAQRCQQD